MSKTLILDDATAEDLFDVISEWVDTNDDATLANCGIVGEEARQIAASRDRLREVMATLAKS